MTEHTTFEQPPHDELDRGESTANASPPLGEDLHEVLACFAAAWVTPYALMSESLEELGAAGVRLVYVDTSQWPLLAENHAVVTLPTFVWFEKGKEKRRFVGAANLKDLKGLCRVR